MDLAIFDFLLKRGKMVGQDTLLACQWL